MTDFRVGDEVVCVSVGDGKAEGLSFWANLFNRSSLREGRTYTVSASFPCPKGLGIRLVGVKNATSKHWFNAAHFRKVQRRDLTAWLATERTVEGPVRPRKRERAS